MAELPVCVRVALWVTDAWRRGADADGLWEAAAPDVDAVGGDCGHLALWGELGERAVLVALPTSGDLTGMPRAAPLAVGEAVAAGECLIAPGVGELLVPRFEVFGPVQGSAADRGTLLTWTAHDCDPVPRHRVEGFDVRHATRGLTTTVHEAIAALEGTGGVPFDGREAVAALHERGSRQWSLPPDVPAPVLAAIRFAASVGSAAQAGLDGPNGALDAATHERRTRVLRDLGREADHALADAANAGVVALAGWAPVR